MDKLIKCKICGSDKFNIIINSSDFYLTKEVFNISECDSCRFRFTTPIPDLNVLPKYYNSYNYDSYIDKPKSVFDKAYKYFRNIAINNKYNLITGRKEGVAILDIGCGTGDFLKKFKTNGWQTFGIEPNTSAREIARQVNKIKVFDEKEYVKLFDNQFDVITMWHSLEHIYDLNYQLTNIKRLLLHDGIILVAVPNSDSFDAQIYKKFWAAYDLPRHLYHFNKKSVSDLFTKYELVVDEIIPLKMDAYYISLISEKYKSGKKNYLKAIINGFRSNMLAKNNNNHSSLLFIIKNKK